MLEQMRQLISSAALLPPGSHVLCAVSGGADSVCLLHALYHLRPILNFSLSAAHYDHGLRGEDSTRDAKFVEQFVSLCCGAQRLPDGRVLPPVQLYQAKGDVGKEAARTGHGVEETARVLRYAFLRQAAQQAQQMQEEAERSGRALVEQTRRDLQQLETQRRRQAAENAEAARQQALREVQADCDALRQRAGAKMPQAVDTILRRVVQE